MTGIDERMRTLLDDLGLDAIMANTRSSVRYLSGVDFPVTGLAPEERTFVLWTRNRQVLLAPGWYDPYATENSHIDIQYCHYPTWIYDALVDLFKDLDLSAGAVGIEAEFVPMTISDVLRGAMPDIKLQGVDAELLVLRSQKAPEEVEKMHAASRAAELGLIDAISACDVGVTEREFSRILRDAVLANGADSIAWLALRWGDTTQRMVFRDIPIRKGELINIEMGCSIDGYLSDVQRMVAATPVDPVTARAYSDFHALLERSLLGIKPGATTLDVYNSFLADMKDAGLEQWNAYFLGHAIGLDAHEAHWLWQQSDPTNVIPEDSFYALEPMILSPKLLAIEDTVHVSSKGNNVVSSHGDWSELVVLGQRVDL